MGRVMVLLLLMMALKAFVLGASGSVSVLASLVDTAIDLVAVIASVLAGRWAQARPHLPHALQRSVAMGSLVQAGLVMASAVFVGWESFSRILQPRALTGGYWPIVVMAVAVVLTVLLVRLHEGRLTLSTRSRGNGQTSVFATDLVASGVVLVGLISGILLRAPILDAIAGLIVAAWLFWGGAALIRPGVGRLMGPGLDGDMRQALIQATLAEPALIAVSSLRSEPVSDGPDARPVVEILVTAAVEATLDDTLAAMRRVRSRIAELYPELEARLLIADPGTDTSDPQTAVPPT